MKKLIENLFDNLSALADPAKVNDSSEGRTKQLNFDLDREKLKVTLGNKGLQSKNGINSYKDNFSKIMEDGFNTALSIGEINPQPVNNVNNLKTEEAHSNPEELKTHRTFMGELSELIFPLCVTDYFVTNQTTSEDIFNALEHIKLTKEKQFVLFDSEVSDSSSLFLSKSEDLKARIVASRKQEVKPKTQEPTVKEYSEAKSEELFKSLGITSEIDSIKNTVLKHFIQYKDSEDASQYKFEGKEEANGYSIIYLAHLYRSKQHASIGQKETDAIKWYRERSHGIAKELDKPEIAFADTKIIKQGRGGVSVALRFIIVPKETMTEGVEHKKVAFEMEDSSDSLRITLGVDYSDNFLEDLIKVIDDPQNEKFQSVVNMIEVYLENLHDVPEIKEAREYLEYLTSNGEVDYIDLNIRAAGHIGAHDGGLIGNIKKDADIKIIEFDAMNRKGVKEAKVFSFSLKASDRKDVATIQFNDKWKNELAWVFENCDLDFKKVNWDAHMATGDSDAVMEDLKKYFISIQSSQNEKLVRFMFTTLDMFAHGHEDSTLISISQSRKDIKVYSTLISEYIRARKIHVSVLDMNDPASVALYYDRIAKRKGESKRGRKPSQEINQFLLQLTDESNDSFGVFKFIQSQTRRKVTEAARGRPAAQFASNPYKITIDDELDELCKKLSIDLKDDRRRKLWSINRIVRRIFLMEKLIVKNKDNPNLLNQYSEILDSFSSILKYYVEKEKLIDQNDEIDYNLIERMKTEKGFNLPDSYSGEYAALNDYMLNSKPLNPENEGQLKLFYATVTTYARQKCLSLIKQIQSGPSQQ
jgi:hypothetical protein